METGQGHLSGFSQLQQVLEICLDIGIQVVSVYAFSIENFKRTKEEVDHLMRLALEKFEEFSTKRYDPS
jgi:ditrans,polycis-polyprenyl diphosphate synthase